MNKLDLGEIERYRGHLKEKEKAEATIEKYMRDVAAFYMWLGENEADRERLLAYKEELIKKLSPKSVNSVISSLNSLLDYLGAGIRLKTLKIQRRIFADKSRELTKAEYERLLRAAKRTGNERLYMLLQTICTTGIRVSELKHITVEAVKQGKAEINCKGKLRIILLPKELCRRLRKYTAKREIKKGPVFITRTGNPLDRSNIWSDMKKLCKIAGVDRGKVFPHNLRHLFARTFYSIKRDIVRLADILGHSSINTTRIYTMESGEEHRRILERMNLLRC